MVAQCLEAIYGVGMTYICMENRFVVWVWHYCYMEIGFDVSMHGCTSYGTLNGYGGSGGKEYRKWVYCHCTGDV